MKMKKKEKASNIEFESKTYIDVKHWETANNTVAYNAFLQGQKASEKKMR